MHNQPLPTAAGSPKRLPEVTERLDMLENILKGVTEKLGILKERLTPVLRQEPAPPLPGHPPRQPVTSPLANRIDMYLNEAESIEGGVSQLLASLEV